MLYYRQSAGCPILNGDDSLMIKLLMLLKKRARIEPGTIHVGQIPVSLKKFELVAGRKSLAHELGTNEWKIYRRLQKLVKMGYIKLVQMIPGRFSVWKITDSTVTLEEEAHTCKSPSQSKPSEKKRTQKPIDIKTKNKTNNTSVLTENEIVVSNSVIQKNDYQDLIQRFGQPILDFLFTKAKAKANSNPIGLFLWHLRNAVGVGEYIDFQAEKKKKQETIRQYEAHREQMIKEKEQEEKLFNKRFQEFSEKIQSDPDFRNKTLLVAKKEWKLISPFVKGITGQKHIQPYESIAYPEALKLIMGLLSGEENE